ncbi:MAG: hypothetical protein ACJZ2G_01645 [Thalassobaculaceae bacterium]
MLVVPRHSQTGYNGHGLGHCPFLRRAEIDIQLDLSIAGYLAGCHGLHVPTRFRFTLYGRVGQ